MVCFIHDSDHDFHGIVIFRSASIHRAPFKRFADMAYSAVVSFFGAY